SGYEFLCPDYVQNQIGIGEIPPTKKLFFALYHRTFKRIASMRSSLCGADGFHGDGKHRRWRCVYDLFWFGNYPTYVRIRSCRKCGKSANPTKNPEIFTLSDGFTWNSFYSERIKPEYSLYFSYA